jgi:excisionase family DNA binding protein
MPMRQESSTATGPNAETERLLTVRDIAELLRVPMSWVYGRTRQRSSNRLPGFRLGKYWRFRAKDIQAWLERQKITA